ncbi:MAG: peptidylprolyl isomerase [Methylicorpusculum sp.]|uniref:FKBP-type peptidyl-prolyl cis-trans isomerase n=1 Tax=Methylicorpusculum sp. TaxID=2713644 RepID=UPI002728062A|nr:peptidylprolyl isomerase [Methylicorpusculum sp.]MDO8845233.1 peptidylprolyl isomerase [Methylicorpusculum sp.]MDO8937645.1 peptidylprolyl isomerase [Methylicorpusculum sp.]MDO9242046.1 peptidylprolyl isomerase [Methylicorpusculum sp.]MDP2179786.1 peptidylprolyl isomerase [Methylicorpusculum sp.]MDP2201978.1 peptidylprolyl isomerase [Methylicorpusculum sp.]
MQVAENMAVSIHYTLTNDAGETLDSSIGSDALVYLHGQGSIIPGLEQALLGKAVGDKLNVEIEPSEAYGNYDEDMVQVIPRQMFEGIDVIEVGMQFHADVSSGPGVVTVINVEGDDVTIDGNHPLAGMKLFFDVEITDIREATMDELAHGHVHGAGCSH